jgi:lipopolysaccharide transport system ATP-binding protein
MSSDVAIRARGLSKCYHVYETPRDRLKQFVLPRLHGITEPFCRRVLRRPAPKRNYYREFWALKDISFEVRQGETVGIIGRNGSGKSTLLQMVCGTLSPTGGTVETTGRVAALLELGAGFNPDFSGRENVYMNASILGLTQQEIDERFDAIAAFADIGDFIEQPVKTYSSGMYVRLAFAVVANVDADILVIDEALAVGDAFFTQKCMRFLRRFREKGTILFVSHDTTAVINLCDHALWLDEGCARHAGTAKEVSEAYLASFYDDQPCPPDSPPADLQETPAPPAAEAAQTFSAAAGDAATIATRDQRLDFLNASNLRNDLEVFSFNEDSSAFGVRSAQIRDVLLVDDQGRRLLWVVGGELVTLRVDVQCRDEIYRPIVGFFLKDRLGQVLFGDNTFLTYRDQPLHVAAGSGFTATFTFRMPILPLGDYSFCVAVAEGSQHDHIQHHWMHDALIIKSHATSITTGLVGLPMLDITLRPK